MDKYALGLKGELAAREYLMKKGYEIIDANVNFPNVGELDIVAKDGNTLVFVEVRTRADNAFGNPLETLTAAKIHKVIAASARYIAKNNIPCGAYRYDAIGILNDNITHIENAFYAKWK
jgi:putative endonuclease